MLPTSTSFLSRRIMGDTSFGDRLKSHGYDNEIEEALWGAVEHLRRLLWECHCNASDGVPVPLGRWLMDGGLEAMPADIEELREAYDAVCEGRDVP